MNSILIEKQRLDGIASFYRTGEVRDTLNFILLYKQLNLDSSL